MATLGTIPEKESEDEPPELCSSSDSELECGRNSRSHAGSKQSENEDYSKGEDLTYYGRSAENATGLTHDEAEKPKAMFCHSYGC